MSRAAMLRMQLLVEQRIFWRNRSGMFFTFVLPLVLLAVLGASDDPVENVPLIVTLGILSTSFQWLAIQLAMHRDQGVLKGVMATPLPPSVLVAGKVLSTMLIVSIESAIVLGAGIALLGAPVPAQPLALAVFVLLGCATFVSIAFAVASIIPTSDSAPAIVNAAYLGLILVTVLLHRIDGIPAAVAWIGDGLPLTHLFQPIQRAWIGPWSPSDWLSALVLVVWCLAAAIWTVRRFRWEPASER